MIKVVHYSIVFTTSPMITSNRIIEGLAVHKGLKRISGDVEQAFTVADMQPQERLLCVWQGRGPRNETRAASR